MVNRRKIKVGIVSFVAVVVIFGIYSFFISSPEIQQPGDQNSGDELVVPDLSDKSSEVAGVGIGKMRMTELIERDEVTGEVKEIFGFEKLLNPERKNERWKLEKPYMKTFEDDLSFEVTADKGDIRVDTIVGEATPSEGTLRGNVVITLNSQSDGETRQSFIYMDTLDYSSDRSEIATKGPFEFVSEDVTLQGTGMVLIYNRGLSRIEYFRISELDYLNIYDTDSLQEDPSGEVAANEESRGKEKGERSEAAVAGDSVEKSASVLNTGAEKLPEESPAGAVLSESASKEAKAFYQCSFFDNVVIRRLDNLVVTGAESINIVNILYGGSSKKKSGSSSAASEKPLAGGAEAEGAAGLSADGAVADGVTSEGSVAVAVTDDPAEEERIPEIVVTCNGSLVVVPMADVEDVAAGKGRPRVMKLEEGSVKGRVEFTEADDKVFAEAADLDKTLFRAVHIDYDLAAGRAYAGGPVKFNFYSKPDPNALDPEALVPIVIDADDNAEYFDEAKKITFNGNVVGTRKDIKVNFVQDNVFYGDQLAVDMYEATPEASELSVKHVAVTGEKVKLKSTRTVGEEIINQVQLFRSRIDYDAVNEVITAGAGGRIEINNANAPVPDAGKGKNKKKKSLGLEGPCYAVVENFESLMWFLKGNTLVAAGEFSGVEIGYIPVVDGKPGAAIQTNAKHLVARFDTSETKRAELLTVTARDGIRYYEVDGNEFIGDNLFYDAVTNLMVVGGLPDVPCFANGVKTERIEYNLDSGKIKTSISSRPGTISTPRKRR